MLGFRLTDEHLKRTGKWKKSYIHRIAKIDQAIYFRIKERDFPPRARSNHIYDLCRKLHSLYIYTNIVQPSLVGNVNTLLLRVVNIPSEIGFGVQISKVYNKPHYKPLLMTEFDTIEIVIKDDTGTTVPFNLWRSIITLHFRRITQN